jgi:nucleoid-associated protein EbfC
MNIGQIMKQVQDMQSRMQVMQGELQNIEMNGEAGGGMVKVLMNGKGELKKIAIDPSLLNPAEIDVLEDLIIAACQAAKTKAEAYVASETEKMMGGLPLPSGMKLPF